jgi:predicted amidohydrolase
VLRVSAVQIRVIDGKEDVEAVRLRGIRLAREAIKSAPHLIVFPEAFTGYATLDIDRVAEDHNGQTTTAFLELAEKSGVHFIFGLLRKVPGGVASSAILLGPSGIIGVYDKIHLCFKPRNPKINELAMFIRGRSLGLFDTQLGRLGVMICYDGIHPELPLALALGGADLLVWINNRPQLEEMEVRYPARFNRIPIVAANRVGVGAWGLHPETIREYFGRSMIVDGEGAVLAAAQGGEEVIITAELDIVKDRIRRLSADGNPLFSRRPDLYSQFLWTSLPRVDMTEPRDLPRLT